MPQSYTDMNLFDAFKAGTFVPMSPEQGTGAGTQSLQATVQNCSAEGDMQVVVINGNLMMAPKAQAAANTPTIVDAINASGKLESWALQRFPYRNEDFTGDHAVDDTGREDNLQRLNTLFTPLTQQSVLSVVSGLGGVGKSQLALEHAHRAVAQEEDTPNRQRTYQLIIYVSGSRAEFERALRALANEELGLRYGPEVSIKKVCEGVYKALDALQRVLLVIDDVAEIEASTVIGLLPPRRSKCAYHCVLTTRRAGLWSKSKHFRGWHYEEVPLGSFLKQEAMGYLMNTLDAEIQARARFSEGDVAALADMLSYFPLALAHMASYINVDQEAQSGPINLRDYIDRYTCNASLVMNGPLNEDDGEGYAKTLLVVLLTTIASLGETSLEALALLCRCAFISDAFITQGLFRALLGDTQTQDVEIATKVSLHLEKLRRLSLINRHRGNHSNATAGAEGSVYEVHQLVQEMLRLWLVGKVSNVPVDLNTSLQQISAQLVNQGVVFPACYYALSAHLREYSRIHNYSFADIQRRIGLLRHMSRFLSHGERLFGQMALRKKDYALGCADMYEAMAMILPYQGDAGACYGLLEKTYAFRAQYLGSEDRLTAVALANWGDMKGRLGEPRKKLVDLKEAIAIHEVCDKKEQKDSADTAATHINIAGAYSELAQNEKDLMHLDAAREHLEKAVVIYKQLFQTEGMSLPESIAQMNLANIYGRLGQADKKKALLEAALIKQASYFEPGHYVVTATQINLANVYGQLGDQRERQHRLAQVLEEQELKLGDSHPDLVDTLVNLAGAWGKLGEPDKQETYLSRALAIQRERYGEEHPRTRELQVALADSQVAAIVASPAPSTYFSSSRFSSQKDVSIGKPHAAGFVNARSANVFRPCAPEDKVISTHSVASDVSLSWHLQKTPSSEQPIFQSVRDKQGVGRMTLPLTHSSTASQQTQAEQSRSIQQPLNQQGDKDMMGTQKQAERAESDNKKSEGAVVLSKPRNCHELAHYYHRVPLREQGYLVDRVNDWHIPFGERYWEDGLGLLGIGDGDISSKWLQMVYEGWMSDLSQPEWLKTALIETVLRLQYTQPGVLSAGGATTLMSKMLDWLDKAETSTGRMPGGAEEGWRLILVMMNLLSQTFSDGVGQVVFDKLWKSVELLDFNRKAISDRRDKAEKALGRRTEKKRAKSGDEAAYDKETQRLESEHKALSQEVERVGQLVRVLKENRSALSTDATRAQKYQARFHVIQSLWSTLSAVGSAGVTAAAGTGALVGAIAALPVTYGAAALALIPAIAAFSGAMVSAAGSAVTAVRQGGHTMMRAYYSVRTADEHPINQLFGESPNEMDGNILDTLLHHYVEGTRNEQRLKKSAKGGDSWHLIQFLQELLINIGGAEALVPDLKAEAELKISMLLRMLYEAHSRHQSKLDKAICAQVVLLSQALMEQYDWALLGQSDDAMGHAQEKDAWVEAYAQAGWLPERGKGDKYVKRLKTYIAQAQACLVGKDEAGEARKAIDIPAQWRKWYTDGGLATFRSQYDTYQANPRDVAPEDLKRGYAGLLGDIQLTKQWLGQVSGGTPRLSSWGIQRASSLMTDAFVAKMRAIVNLDDVMGEFGTVKEDMAVMKEAIGVLTSGQQGFFASKEGGVPYSLPPASIKMKGNFVGGSMSAYGGKGAQVEMEANWVVESMKYLEIDLGEIPADKRADLLKAIEKKPHSDPAVSSYDEQGKMFLELSLEAYAAKDFDLAEKFEGKLATVQEKLEAATTAYDERKSKMVGQMLEAKGKETKAEAREKPKALTP